MNVPIRLLLAAMLIVAAPVLARAQEGKLVLYTSQPNQDAQQTIDAFKAKHPKVDITFVRDGTPRIVAKLRAEMEAGRGAGRHSADRRRGDDGGPEAGRPAARLIRKRTSRPIRPACTTRTRPGSPPS